MGLCYGYICPNANVEYRCNYKTKEKSVVEIVLSNFAPFYILNADRKGRRI